jgi:general secretion pathway protein J
MSRSRSFARLRGLTLIEVLVALALWGLMTALLTQGLDGVTRSQRQQIARSDAHARLQTSLAQWQTDLNQIDTASGLAAPMDWNGQVLRLVRHSPHPHLGYRTVVAWTLREGRWVRWQSSPLSTHAELALAWTMALQGPAPTAGQEQADEWVPAQGWQLFFFYQDSWGNALSSRGSTRPALGTLSNPTGGSMAPAGESMLPDAVRLQLDLAPQGDWQGRLQWDWVRPTWSVTRS